MSFGQEGIDRYIIVYKREYTPSEDEIHARRNGEEWNDAKAKEYVQRRAEQKLVDTEKAKKPEKIVPHSNYKDKYVHLIGQEAALEAAKKTESNKSYGFGKKHFHCLLSGSQGREFRINFLCVPVPSENKKDVRSIEQTMADIQAKKRLKLTHNPAGSSDLNWVGQSTEWIVW